MRVRGPDRHVVRPLPQKSLGICRHVAKVVDNHEHLYNRAQRVEQRQLDRALRRDLVPLLAQVDVTLKPTFKP